MARYAVVEKSTNLVRDIVEWDGKKETGISSEFTLVQSNTASNGSTYQDGKFVILPTPFRLNADTELEAAIMQAVTAKDWDMLGKALTGKLRAGKIKGQAI